MFKLEEQNAVAKMMYAYGHTVNNSPEIPNLNDRTLALALFKEEVQELCYAVSETSKIDQPATDKHSRLRKLGMRLENTTEVADAIGDCLVTLLNVANVYGIPVKEVFDEIMRSNFSKIGEDGSVKKNTAGKVMKPEGYTAPEILPIIYEKALSASAPTSLSVLMKS